MKGRHLFAAIGALALAGAALSFGLGANHHLSSRTGTPGSLEHLNAPEETTMPRADNSADASSYGSVQQPVQRRFPDRNLLRPPGLRKLIPIMHSAPSLRRSPWSLQRLSVPRMQAALQDHQSAADRQLREHRQGVPDSSRFSAADAFPFAGSSKLRASGRTHREFEVVEQTLFQNQEKWEASGDVKALLPPCSARQK